MFELNNVFAKQLKELIPVFDEQTVGIVLDIILNNSSVNRFELIKNRYLGDALLEQVDSQNVLCLQHITLTEEEKNELWMFIRELFPYPMHQSVAQVQLKLYLVKQGIEATTEDYTSSSAYEYDDGYSDFLSYVITDKEVKFIHEPIDGMSSNLNLAISHDDFQILIMELYRAQNPNYSLSKEVKYA